MADNCGVYKITNTITGDFYIGSAVNLRRRLSEHRSRLVGNRHENSHLQHAWNKYGAGCFTFETVLCCDKEHLLDHEQFCIDSEKPMYNICLIAGNCLGRIMSDATRALISAAMTGKPGRKHTDATRAQMSEAHKGKHMSVASRERMSEAAKGKHPSDETRALISLAATRQWAARRIATGGTL